MNGFDKLFIYGEVGKGMRDKLLILIRAKARG